MRKTGLYGYTSEVNIEYPKAGDLLQMANNVPKKIKDLKYKKSTTNGNYFGAFQVILSNGMSSPVFNCTKTNDQDMQSFNIPDYSLVKRVNGTKVYGSDWLCCLIFSKRDGTQIAKVETETGKPYGPEFGLNDSEEIIGIYGNKYDIGYS